MRQVLRDQITEQSEELPKGLVWVGSETTCCVNIIKLCKILDTSTLIIIMWNIGMA